MNNKLKPLYWIVLVNALAAIAINFYFAFISELYLRRLASVFIMLTLVFVLLYIISGFKKEGANDLKFAFAFYILSEFVMIFTYEFQYQAVFHVIVYGLLIALATIKDLGDKKSYAITYTILGLQLVSTVARLILAPGHFRGGSTLDTIFILQSLSRLLMAFIIVLCVRGKYIDKKERGTK